MFISDFYALQVACGAAEFNAQVNDPGQEGGQTLKI